ncbi:MAG TPA: peptidoglycan-associated lipoprotein Pal [Rhizomicrobium sp.]|nr:peptidoglycan-associated lipoprotein Pal [Rhizomicrobium sp.]
MTKYSAAMTIAAFTAALMLAGCSTPKPVAETPPPMATHETPPVTSSIVPGSAEDLRVNVGDTVHFAYNEYNIEDNDKATLQRQATWLQKYPSIKVTVEGDCDERGTREYNLALGARRANAVKEYLVSLGVSSARVDTISYGKEHPICTQSTEDCWAQNRRGVTSISGGANS